MSNDLFKVALQLCESGFSVIPSGGGEKHKQPLYPWTEYQKRKAERRELDNWQYKDKPRLWGIVTGAISGIVVLDADSPEERLTLTEELGCNPHIITPRLGGHWYFKYPGKLVKTTARIIQDVDIRGDGGFVNTIGVRPDGEYIYIKLPSPDNLLPWELMPERIKIRLNGSKPVQLATLDTEEPITEGQRNDILTRIGGKLRRDGITPAAIEAALLVTNIERCKPALPENEVKNIAKSVSRYPSNIGLFNIESYLYSPNPPYLKLERKESVKDSVNPRLSERIEEWVRESSGWFSYEDVDKEFGIRMESEKANRRMIFKKFRDTGVIEAHPRNNKLLRYVQVAVRLVDFKSAGKRTPLTIKYPFGIETYFNTYPGNIVVLAGTADSGKTAFLLNLIQVNQYDFSIFYQTSEMGKEELAARLEKFEDIELNEWNFVAEERSRDFADVIRPDCINIIDYLEFQDGQFYLITDLLRAIHDKLIGGIAIVALQKKRGAELGRGGDFGLEKPRLYLTMDKGKLMIQKAKNWANPEKNPNGLVLKFMIVAGCKLIVTEDWHKEYAE